MSIRRRESKKAKGGYVYEVFITYKENGITQHYTKRGFTTRKEAEYHETLIKAEIQENGKIRKVVDKTLNEVFDEFIAVGGIQYQENTLYNSKKDKHYFQDTLGILPIAFIDYKTLQQYFNGRIHEGIETNKNIRKTLNRVLNYAVRAEYIKDNPIRYVIVKGEDRQKEKTILAEKDFDTLLLALEERRDFRYDAYAAAIRIGYYTGLRISEVASLEKSDFDFITNEIIIDKKLIFKGLKKEEYYASHEMKSKKSKAIIPMPDILKRYMIEWFKENPYDKVICDIEGYYINPTCLSNEVKAIAKGLGIHFNFHMLRHTYSTNLVAHNVDIKTAQELMRHSNFNTTLSLYTHVGSEHKKQVVNDVFSATCVENVLNLNEEKYRLH
ncbi:MAG: site-specific integrase [Erysipelotrichaceae bacterium]|nr:site-specific integrase [Erysipelotrichaceae bacterium]